jgi:hypothetical protein
MFRGVGAKVKGILERREKYTLGFRARAVPKQYISFFLLIIGLEG